MVGFLLRQRLQFTPQCNKRVLRRRPRWARSAQHALPAAHQPPGYSGCSNPEERTQPGKRKQYQLSNSQQEKTQLHRRQNGDGRRLERLQTRPMKGTAPRTQSAESLLRSTKDKAENLMIVDLLRNDLGRIAENGSVKVDSLFDIEAYPTVWQMVSTVSASVPGVEIGRAHV